MFVVWAFLYVWIDADYYHSGFTVTERVLRHWIPREIGIERIVNPQLIKQNNQLASTYG